MSAQGNPARKLLWRGGYSQLCYTCQECWLAIDAISPIFTGRCASHAAVENKVVEGFGPRMYTWSITWTPRHDGPEVALGGAFQAAL